jgi:hypothetical protein
MDNCRKTLLKSVRVNFLLQKAVENIAVPLHGLKEEPFKLRLYPKLELIKEVTTWN